MANKLFDELQPDTPQTQYQNFIRSPFSFLANRKIDIPKAYQTNPHDSVQYLLNSGKMDQNAFNKVFSTLHKMGFKFS